MSSPSPRWLERGLYEIRQDAFCEIAGQLRRRGIYAHAQCSRRKLGLALAGAQLQTILSAARLTFDELIDGMVRSGHLVQQRGHSTMYHVPG